MGAPGSGGIIPIIAGSPAEQHPVWAFPGARAARRFAGRELRKEKAVPAKREAGAFSPANKGLGGGGRQARPRGGPGRAPRRLRVVAQDGEL